jgi:hypothetical protein
MYHLRSGDHKYVSIFTKNMTTLCFIKPLAIALVHMIILYVLGMPNVRTVFII